MNQKPSDPERSPAQAKAVPDFLAGGGEMGALMRAHDWRGSSLGPPALWPQALRTVVRLMLNSGHPMYIWWGADRACLYNDAYRESIGPERHPGSLGRPAREVWDEIWHVIGPQIEQVMSGGGATWHVNQLLPITRHGRREDVYWTYSYSPIDDEHAPGGIGGVLVVCTETTQQMVAARRLATERDRLAQLFEQAPTFMALLRGPDHRFEIANPGYLRLIGHRQVLGRTLAEALPEAVEQGYLARLDQVFASGEAFAASGAKFSVEAVPGGPVVERCLDFVCQPIKDADGTVTGIFVEGADVTEREQAQEQLRIERERLDLALGAGRMGAYDMNLRDGALWWSPQMYPLFGVSAEDFVPTPEGVLALIHPDERDTFLRMRTQAIAEHRPFFHEFRIQRPDGTPVWVGHRGQAEYDAEGRPLRSFGVTMDISERKQVEDMLRDADRKKDRFIAVLAHELRNPLAPIRNAIYLLRRIDAADPKVGWCHDVIDRQVMQMARLLDDLLDVSRLTRGQLRLRLQPLGLASAIEQAVEIAQPLIDAGGHALTVTLPAQSLDLEGDLTRLAQVFSNVLINAAKYTPARGAIALDVQRQGDEAVVTVTDSGIGIAPQHLAQIFEMFGQVESALDHSQGGQGIGLSLAKGLLQMHGGTISAFSEGVGKGSRFEIRLPLTPRTAPADSAEARTGPGALAEPGYRILIADDLRDTADSLALLLEAMGHVVEVAYDGEQALRLAGAMQPEVVLLDLGMPRLNGYEACRQIRATPWGAAATLVAQTGWGQAHDRERTRAAGFDHHLIKPVQPEALVALFRRRA
ncbi:hybrid sensor histidine kinase/response regulator [Variovorax sp. PBL-E5]|uniref:hybrid sensor histidine kinase/response regulator n=1 Tax=Variovorax sp. PBL-E5 TaxID=434014 RepID=UPI001318F456|nr:ATP-binding protein [Variovorax sp. PBL-E5]VTU45327.1 Aerobic respiration control sensor protein ArcB [Variovorax sp. PBL-E5]